MQNDYSAFNGNSDVKNSVPTTLYFLCSSLCSVIDKVFDVLMLLKLTEHQNGEVSIVK